MTDSLVADEVAPWQGTLESLPEVGLSLEVPGVL